MALAVDTWQPFFVSVEQRTVEVGQLGLDPRPSLICCGLMALRGTRKGPCCLTPSFL